MAFHRRAWIPLLAAVLAAAAGLRAATASAQQWADWRQARPFVCRANFSLAGYEPLLVELQQLQQQVTETLNLPPATEPIEIYLFADKASYQAFLQRHHPEAPSRRALYVKQGGPGQVFAYRSEDFEVDLRHETTHAVLHAVLPVVPLWLDEGLAEYFEVASGQRGGSPHLKPLKWNLRLGLVPRLSGLEGKRELSDMGNREYMFAWAWVHFLLHGPPEAREELLEYLADLRSLPAEPPISMRLSRRLPNLEQQFSRHFNIWR